MIEIKFTADTVPELMGMILGYVHSVSASQESLAEPVKRPRGRPPKEPKTFASTEDGVTTLVEEEPIEAASIEPVDEEEEEQVDQTGDAIANEKLKAEVIESLHGLFTSGKVKVVRHVLNTYGNGAKSFPEIDASAFPAIKEALDRGEAA